jgi:hypothetical protein
MRCRSGRHEWLDPVSAYRCCSFRFDRILVKPGGTPPARALPDGRVRWDGGTWVWVPRSPPLTIKPQRDLGGIPERILRVIRPLTIT